MPKRVVPDTKVVITQLLCVGGNPLPNRGMLVLCKIWE